MILLSHYTPLKTGLTTKTVLLKSLLQTKIQILTNPVIHGYVIQNKLTSRVVFKCCCPTMLGGRNRNDILCEVNPRKGSTTTAVAISS